MNPLKNYFQSGFTLAEMVITITIFILIVVTVSSAYTLSRRAYLEGESVAEISQNGRVILERMTREIRQAREIITELSSTSTDATSTIEFEDGHTPAPSPYQGLGSDYFYIRYYIYTPEDSQKPKEVRRQYRVYCFDTCATSTWPDVCSTYYPWNATQETAPTTTHPCILEEKTIGEYVSDLKFWGSRIINIFITLEKANERIDLETAIFGRNL